jgi:hypothetical protein
MRKIFEAGLDRQTGDLPDGQNHLGLAHKQAAHWLVVSAHQLPGRKIARRLPCQPGVDGTLSPATHTELGKNNT